MGAHLRVEPRLPAPFQRLRAAAWVSNLGDGVRNAALPLLAAALDGSATTVALVAAAGTLPFAVFGLAAGTVADRRRRIPLIAAAHLFRCVVMTALAGVVLADLVTVPLLVGAAFLLGCGEAVADSSSPALIPDLVDEHELEQANSELETAELVANDLVGPPVGGALLAVVSSLPFFLDAFSFLSAGLLVRSIRADESHLQTPATSTWSEDMREGARTTWQNSVLRATGSLIVLLQLVSIAAIAPIVVYLTDDLGLTATGYGLFLGIGSLGGIAGARAATALIGRFGSFPVLVGSVSTLATALAMMAVPSLPVVVSGFALSFAGLVVGRIVVVTARQRAVPSRLLGRAQGTIRSLLWGAASVGAMAGGLLSDALGHQPLLVLCAIGVLLALALTWKGLRPVFEVAGVGGASLSSAERGGPAPTRAGVRAARRRPRTGDGRLRGG